MTLLQDILFVAYAIVGPLAWAGLGVSLFAGRQRMKLIGRKPLEMPADPPQVTILIPAKDEEERIAACIESTLKQDYPHFQIIAINDRSVDRTGPILDELATKNSRLTVLHIPLGGLPAGWTGKCHALHRACQQATGEWIFFVDSDVLLASHALSLMMKQSVAREYDFFSVLTRLECYSFWERLTLPLAAGGVSIMYTVSMTNNDGRRVAFANGQCMLVRSSVYAAVGGHEAVRHLITEDVELARLVKSKDYKTRLAWGGDFVSTRMYSKVGQMFRGWGRIYSGLSRRRPWRIVAGMTFVLLSGFSVYAAAAWGVHRLLSHDDPGWLVAAGIHFALMTGALAAIYHWSGNPRRYALLFPAGGAMMLALFTFALKWCATGKIEWRGTAFDQNISPATRT